LRRFSATSEWHALWCARKLLSASAWSARYCDLNPGCQIIPPWKCSNRSNVVDALTRVRHQWTTLGERDPLWAILSENDKKDGGWDQDAFFKTGIDEIAEVLRAAESLAPLRRGSAVDFGCGVGRLSQALSMHFERVIGVDIAESMIRKANEL